jgi:SAM-dependent methyltransferase
LGDTEAAAAGFFFSPQNEPPRMLDYDRLAAEYAKHRRVQPRALQALCAGVPLGPNSLVLEVGCGTGNYLAALLSATGSLGWGIDPSAEMLAKAREQSPGATFQGGKAERLDVPAGSFDLVFSVDVIHHVGDRLAHFREARRVLKGGGRLCTVTDSEWIIRHRQPLAVYFPETVEADLARYPCIASLREMMEEAGLVDVREEMVEYPYPLSDLAPYRDKAFSCLHLISEEPHRRGLERMERDLCDGPIAAVSRYLLLWGTR